MTPQDQQQQQAPLIQSAGNDAVRDQDKIMLVLAYFGLFSLIPLLTVKDSDYVKWHAKQGLVLFFAFIVAGVAAAVIGMIPVIGWIISGCLYPLAALGLSIMAIMKALKGERWRLPVVADLADKINL